MLKVVILGVDKRSDLDPEEVMTEADTYIGTLFAT
jgi:hypothetical protein